jgi:hypothetical protein
VDERTDGGERREGVRVRVPVGVVRADRDQRHPWCGARQEGRITGPRTVVRDGQQPGPERVVPAGRDARVRGGEQVGLRGQLRVAGEQGHGVADRRPQDERSLVHLAAGVPVGAPGRWSEHLEVQVTDRGGHGAVAGADDLAYGGAGLRGRSLDRADQRGGLGRRRPPQGRDLRPLQHRRRAAGVVGVPVGHHDQVEVGVPVAHQPPRGHVPVPGVDQHPGSWAAQQERVTLPDVDRGHGDGVDRQVAADERREPGQDEGDDGERRRAAGRPGPWRGQQPTRAREEGEHRRRRRHVRGAAPAGGGVRRSQDPPCRDGRDPEQGRARG